MTGDSNTRLVMMNLTSCTSLDRLVTGDSNTRLVMMILTPCTSVGRLVTGDDDFNIMHVSGLTGDR